MLAHHTFCHQGIEYTFRWNKERFEKKGLMDILNGQLDAYYRKVLAGNIPDALFNDPNIMRCSRFRLKGLERGAVPKIRDQLIERDLVRTLTRKTITTDLDPIRKIPEMVYQVFKARNENGIEEKPSHDVVCRNLLIVNDAALSMETPIWSPLNFQAPVNTLDTKQTKLPIGVKAKAMVNVTKSKFTGHMDLVLYSNQDDTLVVSDYKPEGNFLYSLPQIATYGLFVKKLFKFPRIICMSFNKDEAWLYDPDILKRDLPGYIAQFGNAEQDWDDLLKEL